MTRKGFLAAVVLFCAAAVVVAGPAKKRAPAPARRTAPVAQPARRPAARPAPKKASAGYRPAGTVAFANLETIARAVAGIPGPKSTDAVLKTIVPNAIRRQGAARLFGPMRPGAHGVAVCYVDPAVAARIAAAKKPSEADLDRAKRWCVVYPASMTQVAFRQRHPDAVPDAGGTLRVPPGNHSRRTLWAWFSPDGKWAALGPSASLTGHAFTASAAARARPIGGDLAVIKMDASGARALFGSDLFAEAEFTVRMAATGLELRGVAHKISMKRPPLPAGALALGGVPANAPLFGVTTTPSDVRTAEDLFAMAGPEFGLFVRNAIRQLNRPGATTYYLNEVGPAPGATPRARLQRILPEAFSMPQTANALFCSPTTVLRLCLPKVAAKLMPMDSAQLHVALRLLRAARGDGLGCMSWHDGQADRLLIRISRDELYGTANLWSMLFL